MHAFRRFIEDQMALRNWQQSDLASASKMSAQLVSKLLKDEREVLPRMPEQSTLRALARAFPPATIRDVRAAAVRAMGVDDVPPVQIDLAGFDDDALLAELGRRIKRSAKAMNPPTGAADAASTAPPTPPTDIASRRTVRPSPKPLPKAAHDPKRPKGEAFDPDSGGYVGGETE